MSTTDSRGASVFFMIFCLAWCGVIVWHLTTARKTGRIFRFSKIPIGGSAFIRKEDDPGGFWFAFGMGCFLSLVLVFGAVVAFLAGFYPHALRYL